MEAPLVTALAGLTGALVVMTVTWIVSLVKRDASIIDIVWGLGFIALAWFYFWSASRPGARQVIVPVLMTIWGLRLALHIYTRNRDVGEDPRYAAMRARRGDDFWWQSLFMVFWLQAVLLWIIGWPLLQVQRTPEPRALGVLDWMGLVLFAIGFSFEAIGDWQLRRFKADPKNRGRVCDRGLWRYSRHPNYFGEATLWWGIACFALATPGGAWTLLSPTLLTFLLLKVSGVTLLEDGLRATKPDYQQYMQRTSAFFPWPRCRSRDRH